MARRSLSREQVRKQICNRLKRNPEHSDRLIAQALGVDHKTVGRVRAEMESCGEVPQVDRKIGLNGMQYKTPDKPKSTDADGGEVPQRLERIFASRGEHASLANILVDVKRRAGELAKHSALYSQLETLRRHLSGGRIDHSANFTACHTRPLQGQRMRGLREKGIPDGWGDSPTQRLSNDPRLFLLHT